MELILNWQDLRTDFAVNYAMSLMTRIQKMSLDYHFKVEQEAGSATFAFFSFNGNYLLLFFFFSKTKLGMTLQQDKYL